MDDLEFKVSFAIDQLRDDGKSILANAVFEMQEQRAELIRTLSVMTGLCLVKYGNLDEDVFQEIKKAQELSEKCK